MSELVLNGVLKAAVPAENATLAIAARDLEALTRRRFGDALRADYPAQAARADKTRYAHGARRLARAELLAPRSCGERDISFRSPHGIADKSHVSDLAQRDATRYRRIDRNVNAIGRRSVPPAVAEDVEPCRRPVELRWNHRRKAVRRFKRLLCHKRVERELVFV